MNAERAKSLLKVCRLNGADAADPEMSEAQKWTRRNPKWARWFAGQQAFDSAAGDALNSPPPENLKEMILASAAMGASPPWWQSRFARVAMAAAIAALLTVAALWLRPQSATFTEYCTELTQTPWDASRHLQFHASTLDQVRAWLHGREAGVDFSVPAELQDLGVHGCSVIEWRGRKVPFICFADGFRHMHLFVVEGGKFSDPPGPDPQFDVCAGWRTASWTQGDKVYILTGMSVHTFVKKFRKAGQWSWTS